MAETEILPAPVLELPSSPGGKWEQEFQSFLRLWPQLLDTHQGQYVAIHEGKLVDSDPDEVQLALRVYKRFGYVPIFVGLVGDRPVPFARIPGVRLVPSGRST